VAESEIRTARRPVKGGSDQPFDLLTAIFVRGIPWEFLLSTAMTVQKSFKVIDLAGNLAFRQKLEVFEDFDP
jgi:hypothetical protein